MSLILPRVSSLGEGNGNPLQCSYLENPRDGGAWWATVYGVAQNRTQLMRLSSSSILCLQKVNSQYVKSFNKPIRKGDHSYCMMSRAHESANHSG